MPTENKPVKPVTAAEELDAVLHWRGKHAQAIKERDALQLRLNAADQTIDELSGLLQGLIDNPFRFTDAYRVRIAAALNPKSDGEKSHEIPGTSGMRLNMLANQGE